MSDSRIRVSRRLYLSALADAIDWTESLIDAGKPDPQDKKRLASYRRAQAAILGPQPPPEPVRTVTLTELSQRFREDRPFKDNQCPAIMPGPPPAVGQYQCELGAGHGYAHHSAGLRWEDR
jgi:hypothetical protein